MFSVAFLARLTIAVMLSIAIGSATYRSEGIEWLRAHALIGLATAAVLAVLEMFAMHPELGTPACLVFVIIGGMGLLGLVLVIHCGATVTIIMVFS
jgi:hypothetical protein